MVNMSYRVCTTMKTTAAAKSDRSFPVRLSGHKYCSILTDGLLPEANCSAFEEALRKRQMLNDLQVI